LKQKLEYVKHSVFLHKFVSGVKKNRAEKKPFYILKIWAKVNKKVTRQTKRSKKRKEQSMSEKLVLS
jgi:hypothetical protein